MMKFQLNIIAILILTCVHRYTMMEINLGDTELQKNVLKFGYGISYKYKGTISHSFGRFYMVTKFELPKVQDLPLTTIPYDKGCDHLDDKKSKGRDPLGLIQEVKDYCVKIALHIAYYKKQIEYCNQTAHKILTNELALILPTFTREERQKRCILTSIITGLLVWLMKVFPLSYIAKDKKLYIKQLTLWKIKQT